MMSEEAKKRIQIALALAIVVAGVRAGYILYQRHEDYVAAQKQQQAKSAGYSNPEYYVTPKKLYPFDLKSAKQLTQQPVWVKEGYRYTYYPYDTARKRTDFGREAGLLLPIERLEVKDVVPDSAAGKRQMMAVFQKEGKSYAVPIGFEADEQYKIYSDEMFYIEDPHDLYKHWPADVWKKIDAHEVQDGMDELQTLFAIGMGIPEGSGNYGSETLRYANGGKPLVVTFENNKAIAIKAGT